MIQDWKKNTCKSKKFNYMPETTPMLTINSKKTEEKGKNKFDKFLR